MRLAIAVAAHKPFTAPASGVYLPIQVGRALSERSFDLQGDDTGENISVLNESFCELTAVYWLWKNWTADAYGLAHYRRYFRGRAGSDLKYGDHWILSEEEAAAHLVRADVIAPVKRRYVIETVRGQYAHAHHESDLEILRVVLSRHSPSSVPAFDRVMARRSLVLFNMFLMRGPHFDEYCGWLFPILFESMRQIDWRSYGSTQRRVFGYLGERLFNVWLEENAGNLTVTHLPVVNVEGERRLAKAAALLRRKYAGSKDA
jgi:hypothetical protein